MTDAPPGARDLPAGPRVGRRVTTQRQVSTGLWLAAATLGLSLVAGLLVAGAQPRAARAPADRTPLDHLTQDEADMPAAPLRVHEWGVWRLRAGQVDHLAELARENPPFVHRANRAAAPALTPRPRFDPQLVADKPVVFVYADTEMDVDLMVEFASGGEPWFYYPTATAGITDPPARRTVRWQARASLPSAAPRTPLASVQPGHFWNALRAVGASPLCPTGSTESERFLFYDGPTTFPRVVDVVASGSGARVRRAMRDAQGEQVWVVDAAGFVRADVPQSAQRAAGNRGTVQQLERQLRAALVARGLSDAEATALLDTWRGDLFRRAERRAIWFLPRRAYDAMLPITVYPPPLEIVRVGVVIQML